MNVWFTSDTHYGHKNIIRYAGRPFPSVEVMDKEMVERWNSVVQPGDVVYHLGDFAFCPADEAIVIAQRLNGHKHLIFGNHDKRLRKDSRFIKCWESTQDFLEIRVADETLTDGRDRGTRRITLCHYAMKVWNHSYRGTWQLFGHSHGTLHDDPNSKQLDVGVDCWNFIPVSYEQVREKMEKKTFVPVDRHGED